jgi:hypothetical protein
MMDPIAAPHSMIGVLGRMPGSDPNCLMDGLHSLELTLAVPRPAIMVGEF